MKAIKSKRQYIHESSFGLFFVLLIDLLFCYIIFSKISGKGRFSEEVLAGLLGFVILFGTVNVLYFVYYIISNPHWELTLNSIKLSQNGDKYELLFSEIISVNVVGKKIVPMIFDMKVNIDATEIVTKDRCFFIPNKSYINSGILRKELSKRFLHKTDKDFKILPIKMVGNETFTRLNKYKILTASFIYAFLIACTFIFFYLQTQVVLLLFISAFLFLVCGKVTTYFEYNDEYLVVRNNVFFWNKSTFRISDIIGLILISNPRSPTLFIEFTFKNFKRKTYNTDSVGSDNLNQLITFLKEKGVDT